jgi:hypothetical protein
MYSGRVEAKEELDWGSGGVGVGVEVGGDEAWTGKGEWKRKRGPSPSRCLRVPH